MPKSYIILICLLILPISVYGEVANINLDALINICEAYSNTINDINVEYDLEVSRLHPENLPKGIVPLVGIQKNYFIAAKPFDQSYKLTQILIVDDGKGDGLQTHWEKSYNNGTYKEYQMNNRYNIVTGSISNKRTAQEQEHILMPLGFMIFNKINNTEPLIDILKGRYDYYSISLDPNITKVNDFNAIEVSCITKKFETLVFKNLSFYFSIDNNYTLVKIVFYNGPQRVVMTHNIIQLKDLGNGIWFPVKANIISDDGLINTSTVTKVKINQSLKDKDFDIEFPPGTKVHDEITGKQYTIKPTQEQIDQSSPK